MFSRCSNCSSNSDATVEVTPFGMHLNDDDDDAVLVEARECKSFQTDR